MGFLDQAIQLETDGELFYRELATQAQDASVKIIIGLLADDEVKHRIVIENMEAGLSVHLVPTQILESTHDIFNKLKQHNHLVTYLGSVTQSLKMAQDIEISSYRYYRQEAKKIIDPEYQTVLLRIADEEEKHASIILDLINYYNSPKQWLEDAEWNHHDEY